MKKILIIEDDQVIANIYRNQFRVDGFQVEWASDGETGLEMVRTFQPNAVILDLMLPKLSGVEVVEKLRSEPAYKSLPIIVFSNTYMTHMVQNAWKAGATRCLSKANCRPKQVIDVVRSALNDTTVTPAAMGRKPGAAAGSDTRFQTELKETFIESLPAAIVTLRSLLQSLTKAEGEAARVRQIQELYGRIHALTGNAGAAGMPQIAQMADALEALLKELYEKPSEVNASTLRTVAAAIDFLGALFQQSPELDQEKLLPANILVVDDEPISCRAVTRALEMAKLKSISVEDPLVAQEMLAEKKFDLVFLDVDMPGMNGFELCSKLRTLPSQKATPVVFVTGLNDFESRANSMMSGGTDFIAKPFMFIELAVKALIHLWRAQIQLVPA